MAMTGEQIRYRGLAALRRELGRDGMIRFLQQFDKGSGDYTKARAELLAGLTMENLRQHVRLKKKSAKGR